MRLTFGGQDYELRSGESVLEGMARHGVGLPSACRAGVCQACLLRALDGDPGAEGTRGLKRSWQDRGYFLACQARPACDLVLAPAGDDVVIPASLARREWLSRDVLAVRLVPDRPVPFRPGQHVALHRGDGVVRVYSIAGLPGCRERQPGLDFHVRVYPGGAMSGWLARAAPGARLTVGEPAGECFYVPGESATALLLAGTGTGIAPLAAIAREALARGHDGPVVVVHGAADPAGLYLGDRPACLAGTPVRWRTAVRSRGEDITAAVLAELDRLPGPGVTRAYLCGGRRSVASMRRALFMAGMSLRHILADEFVPAAG